MLFCSSTEKCTLNKTKMCCFLLSVSPTFKGHCVDTGRKSFTKTDRREEQAATTLP